MNPDRPNFTDATVAREWQAQETAAWQERLGLDAVDGDPRVQRYRALARLLRRPLADALPDDFARRLAQRVAAGAGPGPHAGPDLRFERGRTATLIAAFVLAGGIVVAVYGRQWLPSIVTVWPAADAGASRCLLALGACVGVSWLLERWHRHVH
jgi:hypothetical protein